MHNQASQELSKGKRLSNLAYRNWNTSAYSYNEAKRRYEFKEELGRSNDVPKYIKIEVQKWKNNIIINKLLLMQ